MHVCEEMCQARSSTHMSSTYCMYMKYLNLVHVFYRTDAVSLLSITVLMRFIALGHPTPKLFIAGTFHICIQRVQILLTWLFQKYSDRPCARGCFHWGWKKKGVGWGGGEGGGDADEKIMEYPITVQFLPVITLTFVLAPKPTPNSI